jgi:hypothetical protein
MGERSTSGWWTYFPVAFAIKTPVPTLIALVAALASLTWLRLRGVETALLLWPAIYFLVSLGSALNIGYRHLLPMWPLLWVFVGRLGPGIAGAVISLRDERTGGRTTWGPRWRPRLRVAGIVVLAGWLVGSSLAIAPDYLAFFNVLVGGPDAGWRYLVDSNLDWGQELWALDAYLEERKPERVHLSWFGCTYAHLYGRNLAYRLLPSHFAYPYPSTAARSAYNPLHPAPGLYVIGATNLNGVGLAAGDVFARFRELEPVDRIGHSLFVYDVPGAAEGAALPTCISGLRFKDLSDETNVASLGRGPGAVKWFDHRTSFVLPGAGATTYVLPSPPLAFAPAWQGAFAELAEVAHRQVEGQRSAGGRALPRAVVYALDEGEASALRDLILDAAAGTPMSWSPSTVFVDAEVHALHAGAAFEYGLDLVGYVLEGGASLQAGEVLELFTVWRPRDELPAAASDLKVFVHLMDGQSKVWGGEDRLDMHPPTWERGDLLVQYHRVPLAVDAPAGLYQLEVGLYAPITMERLRLYADAEKAEPVGDRVLLSPITVWE